METPNNNPYAYLEKGEFTSELYKIEIKNLHAKVGFSVTYWHWKIFSNNYLHAAIEATAQIDRFKTP